MHLVGMKYYTVEMLRNSFARVEILVKRQFSTHICTRHSTSSSNTTDWPVGLKLVQLSKNSSCHSGIKQSPYKALFGSDARAGSRSTRLPSEVLERMVTESDLFDGI